jgi:NOL1/NOP2/fmu family ribosome biogenesis protein
LSTSFVRLDGQPYVEWWRDRFGLPPATFADLCFYQRGRSTVWAGVPDVDDLTGARVEAVGIPLLRLGARFWKPTSIAIITLASMATRNVIDLDVREARRFLAGSESCLEDTDPRRGNLAPGFVVARLEGVAIGCGEWHRSTLYSCIPKGKRVVSIDL